MLAFSSHIDWHHNKNHQSWEVRNAKQGSELGSKTEATYF